MMFSVSEVLVAYLVVCLVIIFAIVGISRFATVRRNRLLIREFRNDSYREERCPSCSGGIQGLDPKYDEWGPIARRLFDTPSDDRGLHIETIRVRLCRVCGGTEYLTVGDKGNDNGLREVRLPVKSEKLAEPHIAAAVKEIIDGNGKAEGEYIIVINPVVQDETIIYSWRWFWSPKAPDIIGGM
jgi:hypothetical protein